MTFSIDASTLDSSASSNQLSYANILDEIISGSNPRLQFLKMLNDAHTKTMENLRTLLLAYYTSYSSNHDKDSSTAVPSSNYLKDPVYIESNQLRLDMFEITHLIKLMTDGFQEQLRQLNASMPSSISYEDLIHFRSFYRDVIILAIDVHIFPNGILEKYRYNELPQLKSPDSEADKNALVELSPPLCQLKENITNFEREIHSLIKKSESNKNHPSIECTPSTIESQNSSEFKPSVNDKYFIQVHLCYLYKILSNNLQILLSKIKEQQKKCTQMSARMLERILENHAEIVQITFTRTVCVIFKDGASLNRVKPKPQLPKIDTTLRSPSVNVTPVGTPDSTSPNQVSLTWASDLEKSYLLSPKPALPASQLSNNQKLRLL